MATVERWTGAEVRALREAKRMSIEAFADHLGVSGRMVSKWEARGAEIHPRPVNQAALDTSLAVSSPEVHERFASLTATLAKMKGIECRDPALSEAALVSAFEEEVSAYRIMPDFRDSALEIIESRYITRDAEVSAVRASRAQELSRTREKLQRLIDMRAAEEIEATDFRAQQTRYKEEIAELSQELQATDATTQMLVRRVAVELFNDLTIVADTFRQASPAGKKRLLIALGSNLVLKNKKVLLEAKKWYQEIKKGYSAEEAIYLQARTSGKGSTEERSASLVRTIPIWWSTVNAVVDLIEAEIASGRRIARLSPEDQICENSERSESSQV
ncbi:helix-turn-helix domain-containing protein [Kitasatospora sp. NPDC088346]|uniref:helix-turn-helix domain-containing protein n=1 Tax=Kitasatospora sp. NPDC088346 TaxID=3364073 RepID=UPI0037FDCC89